MRSRPLSIQVSFFVLLAWFGMAAFPARAADTTDPTSTVSAQVVESRIKEVEASTTLDDEARNALVEDYRRILSFIETASTYAQNADAFGRASKSAPNEAQAIREQLEQEDANPSEVELNLPADASAREIDARLQTERANQAAVSAKQSSLEQQLALEANRPRVVRDRLVEASKLLDQLAADASIAEAPDQPPLVAEARRWIVSAQAAATSIEVRMLDAELLSQPMRVELLQAQQELSVRNLQRIDQRILLLEEMLADQRRSETEQIIAESGTTIDGQLAMQPLIRTTAERNVELRSYLQELTNDLEATEVATRTAASELVRVQDGFQTAQQRLEIAGLSQVLGQVLHEQRRDLPNLRTYRRRSQQRAEIIAQTSLQEIQLAAERRDLQDIPGVVAELLADLPDTARDPLTEPLQEMLAGRRTLLKNAIAVNNSYQRALGELDFQENQLLATASEFNDFLAQRLLWVRNKEAISFKSLRALPAELIDFVDPRLWLGAFGDLVARFADVPGLWLVLIIVGGLFWKKSALRNALQDTAKSVGKTAEDSFTSTARALGLTILLALPWPLLTLVAGWELSQSLEIPEVVKAIGIALLFLSRFLFFLSLFRALCVEGGLAEAHFKWPVSATRALRSQLGRLSFSFLVPAFVVVTAIEISPLNFGGELSRLLFVVATVGLLVFLVRVLRPNTGILDAVLRSQGHAESLSWVWLVLGVMIPVAYVVQALAGYLYSALTLMSFLINTLWLLFFLIIAHQLAARWLLVVSRRLQLKIAVERRAAARAKQIEASAGGENVPAAPADDEIDVASIDADTRKLMRLVFVVVAFVGMGAIWSRVLPALTLLRDYTLWEYLDGPVGQQQLMPVTLADILLALAYILVAFVATRTVPSLIEAILRQRNASSGTRLAFATLARYSIALLGVALVASAIGFNWGKIQWLVAALGVGIGFGLQEIIANFISGIIILTERPIRVGDLVTVGDTSGTVTRLQIRATTVTNFDRQELLVPNKEFITGRVLNWSLSDEVIRLVVEVGVAYGTDMEKALALVREAVAENQSVLNEPSPLVTFDAFGDNSLNIIARCFIGSLSRRREIISDLNLAVNQKFNEAGIVIAFPQRDVHLDTSGPLDIRIQPMVDPDAPAPEKPEP